MSFYTPSRTGYNRSSLAGAVPTSNSYSSFQNSSLLNSKNYPAILHVQQALTEKMVKKIVGEETKEWRERIQRLEDEIRDLKNAGVGKTNIILSPPDPSIAPFDSKSTTH